ncbi:aldo/keto reductase [Methylocapsa sp. S129]|uniref:aldo/keto reductase n=1 Tax=Methylocapsa sp. S129 TaxID=1641869 RepID=UPI001FF050BD|nr:aldo/keto reductase [Methylocapsa sp. S129]
MTADIARVRLPDGHLVPCLGQGTWRMGEDSSARAAEVAALRRGVELGLTLIDTAEMYGDGGAEDMLGEALRGLRDKVFLVSKVYPQNAGGAALRRACENSLRRLATDRIDLYLLHWRGGVALKATVAGMKDLQREGKIGAWGVSNLDADDMDELFAAGGTDCATNQILYNLLRRGPEFDLLPAMAKRKIPAMAYSPIEQGRLPKSGALADIARRYEATTFQVALAWVLRRPDIIAIPKAATIEHVTANRRALDIKLDEEALAALDQAFAPPRRKIPLAMI